MGDAEIHVVPLSGTPIFPRLCANCCTRATRHLKVSRAFPRDKGHTVVEYQPYFCDACIAAHRAEQKPDTTLLIRRLLHGGALWIAVFGSTWAASVALPPVMSSLWSADLTGLAASGAILAFFLAIAIGCTIAIWRGSRHLAVKPASSITSAITFTPDLSETFEPAWRRFTLRNTAYAEQFLDANRHLLWTRGRPESQRAMVLRHYGRYLLYALLAIAAVFALADEFGYSLWDVVRSLPK